jgi:probable HAF family extracellular repeat protein
VGWSDTASGNQHAFLYKDGQMIDLGTLGGDYSEAWRINGAGQIVGTSRPASHYQAFLYKDGQMTDLGTLGGASSAAYDINGVGQVVGRSDTTSVYYHAFLYEDGQMTDLNTLIPADSGWVLREAYGINDNGQIVGEGINKEAQSHAYLLTAAYDFAGFFQPVDNPPTTTNVVNAGRSIPVKFSLGGDKGLDIFAAGYPQSGTIPAVPNAPLDNIEQTVTAGASSLSYDATSDQYTYVWKTDQAWSGQNRQLVLKLNDGSEHKANFQFR